MNFEIIRELDYMRKSVRLKKERVNRDRNFRLTCMENKHDYLVKNHNNFVTFVDGFINRLGELTLLHGDSKELDRTKEFCWCAIYL